MTKSNYLKTQDFEKQSLRFKDIKNKKQVLLLCSVYFLGGVHFCESLLVLSNENKAMKGYHLPIPIIAAKVPIMDDAPGPPAFENHVEGG